MRFVALVSLLWLLSGCAAFTGSADSPPANAPLNEWMPRIAIVFPRMAPGGKSPAQSYAVNVSVWPTKPILCNKPASPAVRLYVAKNDEPGDLASQEPVIRQRTIDGVSFPSAEFNGVPANLMLEPDAKYSFVAYVNGQPASNVWVHGSAAPTAYKPVVPTGYASPHPAALDTRIQVVFPHDDRGRPAPVDKATLLNVAVDIFQHGTSLSVPPDADFTPELWMARGNDPLQPRPPGVQHTTYTLNGQGYPRWVFNNVPVQPGQTYHFLAAVGSLGQPGGSYPTIWTHAIAGRTIMPKPDTPPPCIP